jgi:Pyruvate/2-oxoacid:ferredoxin oxidoreductase delta subunit
MSIKCENCQWYLPYPTVQTFKNEKYKVSIYFGEKEGGLCKLYPKPVGKLASDFCGQFKSKEL